ncbi:MAG TPA: Uma2 family endonuclease [Planctomycetota bacterium]|nr:Uma2 family endonuclease [Planctomycetota bacterium]
MHRSKVRATREEYERLPEHVKAELIGGEIVVTPTPSDWHEFLVSGLTACVRDHLGAAARGRVLGPRTEVSVREGGEEHILQPDVIVLPEGTRPTGREWKAPTPVWVAEVLSPSTAKRDRGVKIRLYASAGVREAWLVDPDTETVDAIDLGTGQRRTYGKGERVLSIAIPGFGVDVTALFAV